MAQEIKIEIKPESYAEVYGKLLTLYKMAEKIDSVMQSAEHSVHLTGGGLCAECGLTEENHPSAKPYCLAFIPASR